MSALKDIAAEDVECVAEAIWHGDTVEGLGWGGPVPWVNVETKGKDRWRRIAVRTLEALSQSRAARKIEPCPSCDSLKPNGWKNEHCNGDPEEAADPTRKTTAEWCATHAVRMTDEGHSSTASVLWGAEARIRELEAEISKHRTWIERTAADVARDSDFSPI